MTAAQQTEYDRAHWVVGPSYKEGSAKGFCRGYDDKAKAEVDADERTKRAEAMGLKDCKYRVVPKGTR